MNDYTYRYPVAFTIAGSDSCGGAGIQADLKTFSALGVYGASAITAVTAQNTQGIYGIQAMSPDMVKGQVDAVLNDFKVDAIKIGMLHSADTVLAVAGSISAHPSIPTVLDPVLLSSSGRKLLEEQAIATMIHRLFPIVTLLTPNVDEAAYLTGLTIQDEKDMEQAALRLQAKGCNAVLIKGGHLPGATSTDILSVPGHAPIRLESPFVHTQNTHGTGCTLSSAIAAHLALGHPLLQAVGMAKEYITHALSAGADVRIGGGHGAMNHFFAPRPLEKRRIPG